MLSPRRAEAGLVWDARPIAATDDLLAWAPADARDVVHLAAPSHDLELVALGVAAEVRTEGPARFAEAARAAQALFADVVATDRDGPGPLLVGGFAFGDEAPRAPLWHGFPALRLVLPAEVRIRRGGRTWHVAVTPAGTPVGRAPLPPLAASVTETDAAWRARVGDALAAIRAGTLAKVVLARHRTIALDASDLRPALARLRATRPTCTTFGVRFGGAMLFGSTPELLVRIDGHRLETMALAGSAPPADTGGSLLACPKNRIEHALVADDVQAVLAGLCSHVRRHGERALARMPEAVHLATGFEGDLARPVSAIEAAGILHPTPAVCGTPRSAARARIAAEEPDRGWYTGAVGWMDARGDGAFAVTLRCALAGANRALLFGGSGVVAGSDPVAELAETEAKMSAVTRALEREAGDA